MNKILYWLYLFIYLFACVFKDDSGDEVPVPQEDRTLTQGVLKTLASKLDDLSTCNELIGKHGAALQRSLSELEDLRGSTDSTDKVKAVNERATLFRITSNAMINVSHSVLTHSNGRLAEMLFFNKGGLELEGAARIL